MKLFSRKALVAGAAAVALSFAGTSAAVATEGTTTQAPGGSSVGSSTDKTTTEPTDDENAKKKDGSSDPKEISAWISVFTAVIGALGAVFAFASKHLGFKL